MIDGRQENGRFAAGWKGGPGRPPRAVEADYLAVIGNVCSVDDWSAIVERAVADAKIGNAKAREWLSKHLIGEQPLEVHHQSRDVRVYVPDNRRFDWASQPKHDGIDDDLI